MQTVNSWRRRAETRKSWLTSSASMPLPLRPSTKPSMTRFPEDPDRLVEPWAVAVRARLV
jgi:hypothetical protein